MSFQDSSPSLKKWNRIEQVQITHSVQPFCRSIDQQDLQLLKLHHRHLEQHSLCEWLCKEHRKMWESIPPVSVFEENQLLGCQQIGEKVLLGRACLEAPGPGFCSKSVWKPCCWHVISGLIKDWKLNNLTNIPSSDDHVVGPLILAWNSPKKSSLERHLCDTPFINIVKTNRVANLLMDPDGNVDLAAITITTSLGSSCKQLESLSTYKTFHETDETWQNEVWIYAMYQTVTAVSYSNHTMTRW